MISKGWGGVIKKKQIAKTSISIAPRWDILKKIIYTSI